MGLTTKGGVLNFFSLGFFMLYALFSNIILLNLLIAVMADSYDRVKEREAVEQRIKRAKTLCNIDRVWGNRFPDSFFPKCLHFLTQKGKSVGGLLDNDVWEGKVTEMRRTIENTSIELTATLTEQLDDVKAIVREQDTRIGLLVDAVENLKVKMEKGGQIAVENLKEKTEKADQITRGTARQLPSVLPPVRGIAAALATSETDVDVKVYPVGLENALVTVVLICHSIRELETREEWLRTALGTKEARVRWSKGLQADLVRVGVATNYGKELLMKFNRGSKPVRSTPEGAARMGLAKLAEARLGIGGDAPKKKNDNTNGPEPDTFGNESPNTWGEESPSMDTQLLDKTVKPQDDKKKASPSRGKPASSPEQLTSPSRSKVLNNRSASAEPRSSPRASPVRSATRAKSLSRSAADLSRSGLDRSRSESLTSATAEKSQAERSPVQSQPSRNGKSRGRGKIVKSTTGVSTAYSEI